MKDFLLGATLFFFIVWPLIGYLIAYEIEVFIKRNEGNLLGFLPVLMFLTSFGILINGLIWLGKKVPPLWEIPVNGAGHILLYGMVFIYGIAFSSRIRKREREEWMHKKPWENR